MLKNILWVVVLTSAILVMSARDIEQAQQWEQRMNVCNETGKHCPKHLRGEY